MPVPCIANTCVATNPNNPKTTTPGAQGFVTSGHATATQIGNTLTVNQTSANAILNWQSFNVSADGAVRFQQPTATSVALNRIYQQSPSSIFGALSANGQVYLINPNGILFGQTAKVNVSGLIASSLGISDTHFNLGLANQAILNDTDPNEKAALSVNDITVSAVAAADGTVKLGDVTVAAGAQISAPGGRVLLAGTNVTNAGTLSTPDGQIVLAAGQKVYLQASTDISLRGLVVEVDGGGTAENQTGGTLNAARGNISMIGLAVNQNGRASATTAVTANGSVRLEAADTTTISAGANGLSTIAASHAGVLELGSQSSIDIEPELSSAATTTSDAAPQPSRIDLTGEQILMEGGSIKAPGGTLNVTAVANPSQGVGSASGALLDPNAEIRVHSGTSIDLSGTDYELPMAANLLAIQLRSNELADDPTQRGGPLENQTVYVDVRTGTKIIGATALAQAEAAVPRTIGYFTTAGGKANFESAGDVVFGQGASLNVSGGKTTYDAGNLQTTQLIGANGKLYDIGAANPLLSYTGVLNPTFTASFDKWGVQDVIATPGLGHYQSSYVQGSSAGQVAFAAPAMVLDGTLTGSAFNGPYQRSGSSVASGGTLIVGLPNGIPNATPGSVIDYLTPAITLTNGQPPPIAIQDGAALLDQQVQLPVGFLTSGGFTKTQIYGDTTVTIPAGVPLNMLPGSTLVIDAPRINLFSNLTSTGGDVELESVQTQYSSQPSLGRLGVQLGDGVTIDVRGQWTNDSSVLGYAQPNGLILQNGGDISISLADGAGVANAGAELVIGNGVSLRASGGAWVSRNNTLTGGTGGNITLGASPVDSALQIGAGVELDAYGVNGALGGTFSLSAPRISIASGSANGAWSGAQRVDDLLQPGSVLTLDPSLFSNYGFSTVALNATGPVVTGAQNDDILTVESNTHIDATSQTLMLNPGYLMRPGAVNLNGIARLVTLPASELNASSVVLNVVPSDNDARLLAPGRIDVQAGSSITTDPQGSISLAGVGGVYVDGTLRAQGGTITLETKIPTAGGPDSGYRPGLSLELGSQSVLDVSGTVINTPSDLGYKLGTVLDAGIVNLYGDRGTVVADPGSLIDLEGGSAILDIRAGLGSGVYHRYTVGSAGGSLSVRSPEAISLLGNIQAASGAGNYGNPSGGSFALDLSQLPSRGWFQFPPAGTGSNAVQLPNVNTDIQLVTNAGTIASAPDSGMAQLGVAQIEAAGFDSLQLFAGSQIELSTSTPLNFARQVVFDSPLLLVDNGVTAHVNANYVALSDSQPLVPPTGTLTSGSGTLTVQAQQIDLLGSFGISGARTVTLDSSGDVQLRGIIIGGTGPAGNLTTNGNLVIDAARIYPSTLTSYTIAAQGTGNSITIGQTNASPGVPMSAGGSMAFQADKIDSAGTLIAPFGQITLTAQTELDLEPGSVTSVSAAGATIPIPYGQTELNGTQWVYDAPGYSEPLPINGIPQRLVTLTAPNVSIASGATVNLQGGGDLYAYEWVPGTGGTKDALSPLTNPNLFAVLPSMVGQFAPYDPQNNANTSLTAGSSIYLSGIAGLPAGFYPLLPARDALLNTPAGVSAAFLVEVQPGYSNIVPGQKAALADGTPVIAGYTTFGTTGLHSGGYEGVAVWPGSYGRQLASYQDSLASSYFSTAATNANLPTPNLPTDAGQLSIAVDESLNIAGNVLANPFDSKGKGAIVDVSAIDLEVTQNPGAVTTPGAIGVAASVIDGWHVGELVLGGHPSTDQSGHSTINVQADSIVVDSGVSLVANQVIAVANQSIEVQSGASILSSSALSGGTAPTQLPALMQMSLTNSAGPASGAALLAVSDVALPVVSRPVAASNLPSSPATIMLDQGSTVGSLGAISIDAPGNVALLGNLNGSGANWSLASGSIGFVGQGSSSDTLQITSQVQSELGSASAIRLSSLSGIDIYAPVQLGGQSGASSTNLTSLTLSAQSLNNMSPGAVSSFTAKTIDLQGVAGAPTAVARSGSVNFYANEFDVGTPPPDPTNSIAAVASSPLSISGVSSTQISANNSFVAEGSGAGLLATGDLSITAPVFTAANGASAQISAGGILTLAAPASGGSTAVPATYLGGELDFIADTIKQTSNIVVPAGLVTMTAMHDISLSGSATIDTSGTMVNIAGQSVGAEGGRILLTAGTYNGDVPATVGNLTLGQGTALKASGAGAAQAGLIQLGASGAADLSGGLLALPGTGGAQAGQFVLDAGNLTQNGIPIGTLDALTGVLNSGGFGKEVSIRARTGDLVMSAGTQLTSNQVSLTADSGNVNIAGTITAPDADVRGEIQLFGNQGVTLSGQLHAGASGASGVGGNIELGTGSSGSVNLLSGSVISATGSAGSGTLTVRAPLVANNTNIAVTDTGSTLAGLGQIVIEPVMTEDLTTAGAREVTSTDYANILADVTSKMNNAAANIATSLNTTGSLPLVVRAGVDVLQNGGDLLLDQSLDLSASQWRFGNQPVDLTFRAAGSITVSTQISDGFQTIQIPKASPFKGTLTTTGMIATNPDGTSYDSASIGLVAGADTNSVNPFATSVGNPGDLIFTAGNSVIRTGSGNINLVASRDIQFGLGAEVYTAGRPGAAAVALATGSTNSKSTFNFPTGGGNISVNAGRNIVGTLVPAVTGSVAGPTITSWQIRQGNGSVTPQWGVDLGAYGTYGWNLGSLGGGDVSVSAGGDISTLAAAAADSYSAANPQTNSPATLFSSGGLAIQAGGNIGGGEFYAADGKSILNAGGAFNTVLPDGTVVGSLIALNTAQVSVDARLGITIDAVVNPTDLAQLATPKGGGAFFTFADNSALVLQSTSGNVDLRMANVDALLGGVSSSFALTELPPTLEMRALSADVNIGEAAILFPSATGQLEVLAAGDIKGNSNALVMSDDPSDVPTISSPGAQTSNITSLTLLHSGDIHVVDPAPAVIAAGRDISGLDLSVPKATDIIAGRDIVDLTFTGQNLNPNDVTLISAGRDYRDSSGNAGPEVLVGGPGSVDLLAGRNIDLGLSAGVLTTGNLDNANLPTSQGANLTLMAGLGTGPDYAAFLSDVVAPDAGNQAELVSFVEGLNDQTGLTYSQAQTQFGQLNTIQQWNFLNQIFFQELTLSGKEANTLGYGRGYAAIDALFPNSRSAVASGPSPYAGQIDLTFSQLYTQSGGTISIFTPGGGLNVGLAVVPASLTLATTKLPYQLGIVAQGAGDVNIYTQSDVLVNSSRIFTLGGGNIMIWSDEGNIDAGRGAKSSTSAPPPTIAFDGAGNIQLNFQGAVSGSGIRTIQADPGVGAGDVELIAPEGTINAGDAGIGAAGNITLAALHVLGVDNIQYGGQAVGVPPLVSNIGVSLASVSNVANSATNNAQATADEAARRAESSTPLAQAAISWLDVFVTGLGEENCRPDDLDCLKRQKKD
ncbi:MAG: hemagglutinin-related protein [Gammaproteobacteria bacterium]|nr:hemagglutinin-related protein [Gammaproteobacteria bacterium]